jgi:hypothetical protein
MIDWFQDLNSNSKLLLLIAAVGWTIAIFQIFINQKHKKVSIILEKRITSYNDYLVKINEIRTNLESFFLKYTMSSMDFTSKLKYLDLDSDSDNDFFDKGINDIIIMTDDFSKLCFEYLIKSRNNLQDLRLICSIKTYKLVNEYNNLLEKQIQGLIDTNKKFSQKNLNEIDTLVTNDEKLKSSNDELMIILDRLERQMRIDIGIKN